MALHIEFLPQLPATTQSISALLKWPRRALPASSSSSATSQLMLCVYFVDLRLTSPVGHLGPAALMHSHYLVCKRHTCKPRMSWHTMNNTLGCSHRQDGFCTRHSNMPSWHQLSIKFDHAQLGNCNPRLTSVYMVT